MRIQVIVDIRNPLKTGFHLRSSESPDIWVDFEYEILSQFCYNCGRIGHVYRTCKFPKSNAKFGPWLRATSSHAAVYTPPYFMADPRVFSREVCTDLVALPPSKAIVKLSMAEIWPKIESGCRQKL